MIYIYIAQGLMLAIAASLFSLRYPAIRTHSRIINRACTLAFIGYLALITAGLAEVGAEQTGHWAVGGAYLANPRCVLMAGGA